MEEEGKPRLDNNETSPDYHGPTSVMAIYVDRFGSKPTLKDIVGRITIVNLHCNVVYDRFLKPKRRNFHLDVHTPVTGIREEHVFTYGVTLKEIRRDLGFFLKGRMVVGYRLIKDIHSLNLPVDGRKQRDVDLYVGFRRCEQTRRNLVKVAYRFAHMTIEDGPEHSIQCATAIMKLYNLYHWDADQHIKAWPAGPSNEHVREFHKHIAILKDRYVPKEKTKKKWRNIY